MTSPGVFGFIKRMLPFVAALVLGVMITSLFVDLNRPRFGRGWKGKKHREIHRLRLENQELKNENLRLRNEIETKRFESLRMRHPGREDWAHEFERDLDLMVPPPPIAPVAPVAPGIRR
ncbi:MAG: hypothetical protein AB7J13_12345 [Pyrinomonadaceae bacterium]